jgi:acyl-CoA thioester hydrolase
LLTTYRGCVNAWECDQWGHQNVAFYIAKAADAQAALCSEIGLTPSWLRSRGAMVTPVRERILFQRELLAGDAVSIRSGVRRASGTALQYFSLLANDETGTRCTVFETEARLADIATGMPIDWPPDAVARASQLAATHAGHPPPAPIEGPRAPGRTPEHAVLTHRGCIDSFERDDTGWTPLRFQVVRFAQATHRLNEHLGLSRPAMLSRNIGIAALDYWVDYRLLLRGGQPIDIRSGVLELRGKLLRTYHHLIVAGQDEIATSFEVAFVFFDLTARKAVPIPPEIVAACDR